jgi:hypothetical protein
MPLGLALQTTSNATLAKGVRKGEVRKADGRKLEVRIVDAFGAYLYFAQTHISGVSRSL